MPSRVENVKRFKPFQTNQIRDKGVDFASMWLEYVMIILTMQPHNPVCFCSFSDQPLTAKS